MIWHSIELSTQTQALIRKLLTALCPPKERQLVLTWHLNSSERILSFWKVLTQFILLSGHRVILLSNFLVFEFFKVSTGSLSELTDSFLQSRLHTFITWITKNVWLMQKYKRCTLVRWPAVHEELFSTVFFVSCISAWKYSLLIRFLKFYSKAMK